MSNYMSVTVGQNGVTASQDGFSKGVMEDGAQEENKGTRLDAQESMKGVKQSVTISGGSASYQETGPTRVTAPTSGSLPGTLSTLKTPFGAPINDMTEVKPDSRLEIGGTQVEIKTALNMGLVTKDALGNIVVKGEEHLKVGEPQPEPETPKQKVVEVELSGNQGHREVVNSLKTKVGSRAVDGFMAKAMDSVVTGKPVDHLMADFAQQVGGDADTVHNWTQDYISTLYTNGLKHIASAYEVDSTALETFVRTKTSRAYQSSLLYSLYHNNLKAGHELVAMYKRGDRVGV